MLADHPQEKAIVDALGYEEFDVNVNADNPIIIRFEGGIGGLNVR